MLELLRGKCIFRIIPNSRRLHDLVTKRVATEAMTKIRLNPHNLRIDRGTITHVARHIYSRVPKIKTV